MTLSIVLNREVRQERKAFDKFLAIFACLAVKNLSFGNWNFSL